MSVCNTNAVNKLCQKINNIECECKCAQKAILQPKLEKERNHLQKYFREWVPAFKAECLKNGKFGSFKEYLEKCQDFSKPYFIKLKQSDFDVNPVTWVTLKKKLGGTLRIVNSSYLQLAENIVLNFNSFNQCTPTKLQTEASVSIPGYNQKYLYPVRQNNGSYDLGFFAGITIETNDVVLDLNNYEIKMAKEYYLLQRFCSLIELASSPFIPKQGPGDFGEIVKSAKNCAVINGTLGLSSHHSIHGNSNNKVWINNVKSRDFEFGGFALNDSDNLLITNCEIGPNWQKVPVVGQVTSFIFMLRALKLIKSEKKICNLKKVNQLYVLLNEKITKMTKEFLETGLVSDPSLQNPSGLPDGLVYGIVINRKGVAINEFSSCCPKETSELSQKVFIKNVNIHNLKANPDEVISLLDNENKVSVGAFGAILPVYKPTPLSVKVLSNLSELLNSCPQYIPYFSPTNVQKYTNELHLLAQGDIQRLQNYMRENNYKYKFNADIMNHVHKGVMALRLDGVNNALLSDVSINNIQNLAEASIRNTFPADLIPKQLPDYDGNTCRAIAISGSSEVIFEDFTITKVLSKTGCSYGFALINGDKKIYHGGMKISEIITLSNEIIPGNKWPESRLMVNL